MMFDDEITEEESSSSLMELMEKQGITRPVFSETEEVKKNIPNNKEDASKKFENFLSKKFTSSPDVIITTALENKNLNSVKEKEYKILEKYNSFSLEKRKAFLKDVFNKYQKQREQLYHELGFFSQHNLTPDEYEKHAKIVAELSEKNIILREIVQRAGIKIYKFTGLYKQNLFYGEGLLLGLASFSFLRNINIVCPKCGHLVATKPIDLSSLYHKNAAAFVRNLHGKLIQDCEYCKWFFLYEVDVLTNFPNLRMMLSEEPKVSITENSARPLQAGRVGSKNKLSFLLPLIKDDSREELLKRWEPLIGKKRIPTGKYNDEEDRVIFDSRNFKFIDSHKKIAGIELSLILNQHVIVHLFFEGK